MVINKSTRGLTAKVQHYTGRTILESSTDEWSLAKHLYRPYDMAAYINFGRVSDIFYLIQFKIVTFFQLISDHFVDIRTKMP